MKEDVFWLNDNKSVVVGVTLFCGLVECEQESYKLEGVYKVNLDGTNWQKINEIPNVQIGESGIKYWY